MGIFGIDMPQWPPDWIVTTRTTKPRPRCGRTGRGDTQDRIKRAKKYASIDPAIPREEFEKNIRIMCRILFGDGKEEE